MSLLLLIPANTCAEPPLRHSVEPLQVKWTDNKGPQDETVCSTGYLGNGMWLTAGHCFTTNSDDMKDFSYFIKGKPAKLVLLDEDNDVAVLAAFAPEGEIALVIRETPLEVGDALTSEGFPGGGYDPFFVTGHVMNLSFKLQGKTYVISDLKCSPGMSGAPVIDVDGKLVGVLQSGWEGGVWRNITGSSPLSSLDIVKPFTKE